MCIHVCACTCVYRVCIRVIILTSIGILLLGGGRNILEETLFLGITDYSHFV